jgi:iron complex outermembrane receptor protein
MKIFSFIVLVFALFQANAQEKNYQLINQETNQPVVEATVHIIFSNSKIETDEQGEFIINFNNEAEIEVRIISQGFESLSKILKTDDPTRVIYLTPQNNKLPEILISGRVFTDPVMNISTPDLTEKVTQPKNVADSD